MIDCATIKDLMPLYVDDVLSRESKALVSGHLATCESCKNEFVKMQSEFVKLPPNDGDKIDVLKSMKKKIFRQKVSIAGIVGIVAIALLCCIFLIKIPLSYDDVRAEVVEIISDGNNSHWWWGGVPTDQDELDEDFYFGGVPDKTTISSTDLYLYVYLTGEMSTVYKDIERNGELIRVVYFRCSPTIANLISDFITVEHHPHTQIWIDGRSGDDTPKKVEIYYLTDGFEKLEALTDEQFDTERQKAILLWSGVV